MMIRRCGRDTSLLEVDVSGTLVGSAKPGNASKKAEVTLQMTNKSGHKSFRDELKPAATQLDEIFCVMSHKCQISHTKPQRSRYYQTDRREDEQHINEKWPVSIS
jgi:hypothetical protein